MDNGIINGCECYDSYYDGTNHDSGDGIHISSSRNVWVLNSAVHDNGEQGIDISRDGDYKKRDDGYNVTIRDCVGYNNYKQNFDCNSGYHDVYFVRCVGYGVSGTETMDANFTSYGSILGTNWWINCTATKHWDKGFGWFWWGYGGTNNVPAGTTSYTTLINCVSAADQGQSMYVEADVDTCGYEVIAKNCDFYSLGPHWTPSYAVTEKGTNYTRAQVNAGTGRWLGTGCMARDPLFVNSGTNWATSNLRLQANSPCIDAGIPLFTVSGSGTGTNIAVTPTLPNCRADMIFRPRDKVSIGVAVSSVFSVSPGALTLTASVAYSEGQLVWFQTAGNGVDIGAYEYGIPAPPRNERVP